MLCYGSGKRERAGTCGDMQGRAGTFARSREDLHTNVISGSARAWRMLEPEENGRELDFA